MFEDFEEENPDVTPDSPDRAIAWAIHSRGGDSGLTPEEAWAILHERYPDDPRFLLLNTYGELGGSRKGKPDGGENVFTPSYFLKKVERILSNAPDAMHVHIRDLVVFGGNVLAGTKGDDATLFAALRTKIHAELEAGEPKRDDRDREGLKLRRYEREIVKELDQVTQDNKPIGVRAPSPQSSPHNDSTHWATAVADKDKPRRKYAADGRFEKGELIEHPKFGVGVCVGIEPKKVHILFESGSRKLVAG